MFELADTPKRMRLKVVFISVWCANTKTWETQKPTTTVLGYIQKVELEEDPPLLPCCLSQEQAARIESWIDWTLKVSETNPVSEMDTIMITTASLCLESATSSSDESNDSDLVVSTCSTVM